MIKAFTNFDDLAKNEIHEPTIEISGIAIKTPDEYISINPITWFAPLAVPPIILKVYKVKVPKNKGIHRTVFTI